MSVGWGVSGEDIVGEDYAFSFEPASGGVLDGVAGPDVLHPVAEGWFEECFRHVCQYTVSVLYTSHAGSSLCRGKRQGCRPSDR